MGRKIYLALVSSDFSMSDEVIVYFRNKGAVILSYSQRLGIITLQSTQELIGEKLKYILHIELNKEVGIIDEEE